ncbi:MAG TPA: 2-C-methyl-D-erythritol 4-phosphate cytidylyltransferase [Microscillaceae bacterium]|jgi:2-C-methyl-D-erythritol 4-phosphate cytidylyltransferase|nr:2-C-methyl-D-erythritol 4-phosphate cytidylyltransferase [Microscillaceae bacterium]
MSASSISNQLKIAILVAGGTGTRMQSSLAKQFLLLAGKPILMHSISRFYAFDPAMQLLVVLPDTEIKYWETLCNQYAFAIPHRVVAGGATRFESVRNGLAAIQAAEGLVAIHDGVRPLITQAIIARSFEEARQTQAAIAVVSLKDSIRQWETPPYSKATNRSQYCLVQTPQTFDLALLRQAYQQPFQDSFTDDASVVEALGKFISTFEGAYENIKITTPEDLVVAEALWAYQQKSSL